MKRIIVVGGGPAGLMAAIRARQLQQDVILIEKNPVLGRKLLLSGKGRCNLTNLCDLESFLKRFSHNGQFLRDAFKKFFNRDLIKFFEDRSLKLKVERQQRVFPVTDKSGSILEVLKRQLTGVKILYNSPVKGIAARSAKAEGVILSNGELLAADRVILATGGISYSFTGSTGDGFKIARKLGHTVVGLRPGLVPLDARQKYPSILEGLPLKNIRIKFISQGPGLGQKQIITEIGELLFTATGISGPLVLTESHKIADWLLEGRQVCAEIDLKPALSREQLDSRLLREFKSNPKKSFKNVLKSLLPQRMIDCFIDMAGIAAARKVSQVTKIERDKIISLLKGLRLDIVKTGPIEEAMVTCGGISLKEINPRTMGSRLISGLYFAGEVMDIDADTGGFNLQAAFSTGYLAAESAAGD